MKLKSTQLLIALILLCCAGLAQAALTCTAPVVSGYSTAINAVAGAGASAVPNIAQGTVTFNCTRTVAVDATSVLVRATNGANVTGVQNRARLGATANYISYEAYQNSACSTVWTDTNLANYKTVTLLNVLGAQPLSFSYWGCITVAPVVPAGTYVDTVAVRVRNAANSAWLSAAVNLAVSINATAVCTISTPPGNVAFGTYTAFGPTINASTTFKTTCTLNLPYTISLDAYVGVISGLNYSLNINSTIPTTPGPATSAGTGVAQTHTINGNMPAGQAGTCATGTCVASQTRTLTITY